MHCYVYKGERRDDHYLYLSDEIVSDQKPDIPEALLSLMGELSFVIKFDLSADQELPQADAKQVMQDILDQGYYLQMPKKDMQAEEDRLFN